MKELEKILNGMSFYVRRAWDGVMPVDWEIPPRYIYDFEFLYVKGGRLILEIENVKYEGNVGDLFFIPPGKIHSIKSVGKERVLQPHVHFDFYYDESSTELEIPVEMPQGKSVIRTDITKDNPFLHLPYKMTFRNFYKIDSLLESLIIEKNSCNPFSALRLKSLFTELLYLIYSNNHIENEAFTKGNAMKIVRNANKFIQSNSHRSLTMDEIADEVGYSKNYFADLYRSISFISPIKYHEKLRAERAKNLLESTALSISEISEELGFDSLYSFSRFFKRSVGCSPSSYKANGGVPTNGEKSSD